MIFVCGDIHGKHDMKKIKKSWNIQKELTKSDTLIQLGDFGWIWEPIGSNPEQEYWLNWLANRKYTLLVVLGNHENYDEIEKLPWCEKFGGQVQYYESTGRFGTDRIYFAKRGEIYIIEDKTFWCFGGALSNDKDSRTLGVSHWEQELPTYAEYEYGMTSLDNVNWNVDFILSHTCPACIIPDILHRTIYTEGKFNDPVAKYFDEIYNKVTFNQWHFGHFHSDLRVDHSKTNDGIFRCHYNKEPYNII